MRRLPILLPIVALLAGCPGGSGGPDASTVPCEVTMELSVRADDGTWIPAATATHAQLIQGFQGFRYVYLRALVGATPPDAVAIATTAIDDGLPHSQVLGALELTPDGDLAWTQALQVFFNDETLAELVGHRVRLTLTIGDLDRRCTTFDTAEVVLDHDPSCVEGPDGTLICTDAGVP